VERVLDEEKEERREEEEGVTLETAEHSPTHGPPEPSPRGKQWLTGMPGAGEPPNPNTGNSLSES
jgi:hypothetical protein